MRTVAPARLGQRVDRRAAGVDVGDHLGGHLRRVGGYAGVRDAVVTGEHHHPRALELPRRTLALARRHPHRQVLEAAQRAERLGQGVLAGAGGRGGVRVGRLTPARIPSRFPAA